MRRSVALYGRKQDGHEALHYKLFIAFAFCFVGLDIGPLEFIWNLGFGYWNLMNLNKEGRDHGLYQSISRHRG